jgi:hypothetical protein
MPTTTKSIGATGRDFVSIVTWITYLQARTFAGDEVGEMYADAEFAVNGTAINFTGITNGSNWVRLTTGAGQSFMDHASKTTNPLRYNASVGVGVNQNSGNSTFIASDTDKLAISKIQFKKAVSYGYAFDLNVPSGTNTLDNLIIHLTNGSGPKFRVSYTANNVLVIFNGADGEPGWFQGGGPGTLFNCLVARTATAGSTKAFQTDGGTHTLTNCGAFGCGTNFQGTIGGSNNASNGTISFGTSNQASKTTANQFVSVTTSSEDFRLKSGNDLAGNGTATGAPATDIIGQTRDSPPDIGPWEEVVGGGGGGGSVSGVQVITAAGYRETASRQARRLGFSGWRQAVDLRRAA